MCKDILPPIRSAGGCTGLTGSGSWGTKGFAGQDSNVSRVQYWEQKGPHILVFKVSRWLWVASRFRPGELRTVLVPTVLR